MSNFKFIDIENKKYTSVIIEKFIIKEITNIVLKYQTETCGWCDEEYILAEEDEHIKTDKHIEKINKRKKEIEEINDMRNSRGFSYRYP